MSTNISRSVNTALATFLVMTSAVSKAETSEHRIQPSDCWEIHSLGALGGDLSLAFDVNDFGQVVGIARVPDPADPSASMTTGFISAPNGGPLTAIHIPGATGGTHPIAINNAGRVVGNTSTIGFPQMGFVTDPGGTNPRTTLTYVNTRDINNVGQTLWDIFYPYMKTVMGPSDQPANTEGVGLIEVDVLPTVSPAERFFLSGGFNDAGQVAVTAYRTPIVPNDPGTPPAAYRWSSYEGAIQLAPDATYSLAHDINAAGQVIGILNREGVDQAFVTRRYSMSLEMLGTPGDGNFPTGINNYTQIVGVQNLADGTAYGYVTAPFFVHRSIRIDTLSEVTRDGWTNMEPQAINNRGQVAGYGIRDGQYRAFLLTPLSPMAYLPTRDGTQAKCYRISH